MSPFQSTWGDTTTRPLCNTHEMFAPSIPTALRGDLEGGTRRVHTDTRQQKAEDAVVEAAMEASCETGHA